MSFLLDSSVHHLLIRGLIDDGKVPNGKALAEKLSAPVGEIEASLRRLNDVHGLVLHPHVCEPWIIHPFSTSPTATWVQQGDRGWWAPCCWCALGIAALVGGDVTIHTRIGGEAEDIDILVRDGVVQNTGLWAHFPEPPRLAWGNVHHFCARLLPFHSPADVTAWTDRHALPLGAVLPLSQLADLARRWYGAHADAAWRKWTMREASDIFKASGLTGPFWSLETRAGTF